MYQDSITVVVTDEHGNAYSETVGITLGTDNAEVITGTAENDIVYGFGGNDTINGGAGDDTIVGGDSDAAPGWVTVNHGDNFHGTTGADYYSWTAGENESAVIRLNYSPSQAAEGDGTADYVRVETTENTGLLTIGDFDAGTDRIVLQEQYASIQVNDEGGRADITITYDNGNTQSFRVYHGESSISVSDIFTTEEPTLPTGGDVLTYDGDASDFDVSFNAVTGEYTITDNDTDDGLDEGTDTVIGVETFSFDGVEVNAADFKGESSVGANSFDYDTGYATASSSAKSEGSNSSETLSNGSGADQTVYARGGDDTVATGSGDDAIYAGSGDDTVSAGAGDDTIYGGTGDDLLSGGDGSDLFVFTSVQGNDTVDGGAGWTDVLELAGFSGDFTISGNTIDGDGWTVMLDEGHSITGETLDSIEFSADASGVISFDEGGTIDFTGIEKITI